MKRALFIAIISLVSFSCNNSGDNSESSDLTTDTMMNMNNGASINADTSSINAADIGSNADTIGRASGTAGGDTTGRQ